MRATAQWIWIWLMAFPLPLDSMPVLFPSFPLISLLILCPLFLPECCPILLLLPNSLTCVPLFLSPEDTRTQCVCSWSVPATHTRQSLAAESQPPGGKHSMFWMEITIQYRDNKYPKEYIGPLVL